MTTKLTRFIKHNAFLILSQIVGLAVLYYAYGCQSTTTSIAHPDKKVNRLQLNTEVKSFLAASEAKIAELDAQDQTKIKILSFLLDGSSNHAPGMLGIIATLSTLTGLGTVLDNRRKDTVIKTLKTVCSLKDKLIPATPPPC